MAHRPTKPTDGQTDHGKVELPNDNDVAVAAALLKLFYYAMRDRRSWIELYYRTDNRLKMPKNVFLTPCMHGSFLRARGRANFVLAF